MKQFQIPQGVQYILKRLHANNHEAYIVGGCVRDMILGQTPYDYDITTSADPLEVKALFKHTIDTGLQHGTVTVIWENEAYEITTYRIDGVYLDHRRPEAVTFTKSLEEDLKRRDFTINAMAYSEEDGIVDLFGGQKDLKDGIVRCVGEATERFREDALRMLRAIRFAARFGFKMDQNTIVAIKELGHLIQNISAERIHVELTKTLCSPNPEYVSFLVEFGLLEHFIPEFLPCVGMPQHNPYHLYTVDQHTYNSLKYVEPEEALRFTMYLHDIGKGYTRTTDENGVDHFYGHPEVSVQLAKDIMNRLRFDNKTRDKVLKLITYHDYRFMPTKKATRKAMALIGKALFFDYLAVQTADIKAQAPAKADEQLQAIEEKRKLAYLIEKDEECTTLKDLAVSGKDLLDYGIKPGKQIGDILNKLLEIVVEDPEKNNKDALFQAIGDILSHAPLEDKNHKL